MKSIYHLLEIYGSSHQNPVNKKIHWICVPLILFTLFGLMMHLPFVMEKSILFNWASVFLAGALVYYFRLSKSMFIGFLLIGLSILYINWQIRKYCIEYQCNSLLILLIIFSIAWIGQFIGHKIEGKKPSFFEDFQFLLIGPAWLLAFIFRKFGIKF